VAGFTVTAFEAGVPGSFIVAPELEPEEELDASEDELESGCSASEDELDPDELAPEELPELVDPIPDDVPDPEVLEFDPDAPELAPSIVPELDPCSLEPEPPFCVPPPHAPRASEVARGATRRDRIRMG
jgi:hypothetical protein